MEWWLIILIFFVGLMVVMLTEIPVAFAFMLVSLAGVVIFWGGEIGIKQYVISMYSSVNSFTLIALSLFILMGDLLFHAGIGSLMIQGVDVWLGRLPGRLSLMAVALGTLLAATSGSGAATTAVLGELLVPEMEKRGYKKPMTLGPIMASGGLAVMIPPSGLAVLLGGLSGASVAAVLIGGIIPGLLMAFFYVMYIIIRCWLQPSIAPAFDVPRLPLLKKLALTARCVLPLSFIILAVTGVIFAGIATPSEAAALGVVASLILAALYRNLSWEVLKKALFGTISVSGMIFLITVGSAIFSQILAFSGAAAGLVKFVLALHVSPIVIVALMQVAILLLGAPMPPVPIIMITLPIFMPIISALHIDAVWFLVMMLLNLEMAGLSPPIGTYMFVMKGVAPPDTTMGDIYRATLPWLGLDVLAMISMLFFPSIVLWLPSLMR